MQGFSRLSAQSWFWRKKQSSQRAGFGFGTGAHATTTAARIPVAVCRSLQPGSERARSERIFQGGELRAAWRTHMELITGASGYVGGRLLRRLAGGGASAAGALAAAGARRGAARRRGRARRPAQRRGARRRARRDLDRVLPRPLDGARERRRLRRARPAGRRGLRPRGGGRRRRAHRLPRRHRPHGAPFDPPRLASRGRGDPARRGPALDRAARLDRDRGRLCFISPAGAARRAAARSAPPRLAVQPHAAHRRARCDRVSGAHSLGAGCRGPLLGRGRSGPDDLFGDDRSDRGVDGGRRACRSASARRSRRPRARSSPQ